jgi:hypothetical protein
VNVRLFRLLQQFADEFARTRPPDLEHIALTYLERAYELGRKVGRSEHSRHNSDYPPWQRGNDNEQGGSGPEA